MEKQKKQRVSPTALTADTETLKASFKAAAELPTVETVNDAVSMVTKKPMSPEKVGEVVTRIVRETPGPESRNDRKRETIKGTILQSVMIDIDLLKKVKREAFERETSLSDVINNALKNHFQ